MAPMSAEQGHSADSKNRPAPVQITVSWSSPFSAEFWAELEEAQTRFGKQIDMSQIGGGERTIVIGPVLPDEGNDLICSLALREHAEEKPHLFWMLSLFKKPTTPPPSDISEGTLRLGGQTTIRDLIVRFLKPESMPIATYQAAWRINGKKWLCRIIPQTGITGPLTDSVMPLAKEVTIEQIGYRLQDGIAGVMEIGLTYYHANEEYSLDILGRSVLRFERTLWIPHVSEMAEAVFGRIFVSRE